MATPRPLGVRRVFVWLEHLVHAANTLPALRPQVHNYLYYNNLSIYLGLGFGALQRAPHPHCARPANPRLMPRVCSYGLAQRRRQETLAASFWPTIVYRRARASGRRAHVVVIIRKEMCKLKLKE
jgi:hypothetical protein